MDFTVIYRIILAVVLLASKKHVHLLLPLVVDQAQLRAGDVSTVEVLLDSGE